MFTVLCFKCTPVYVKIEIFLDKVQSRLPVNVNRLKDFSCT